MSGGLTTEAAELSRSERGREDLRLWRLTDVTTVDIDDQGPSSMQTKTDLVTRTHMHTYTSAHPPAHTHARASVHIHTQNKVQLQFVKL